MKFLKTIILFSVLLIANFSYAQNTLNKVSDEICKKLEKIDSKLSEEEKNKKVESVTMEVFLSYAVELIEEYNIDIDDSEAAFEKLGTEVAKNLMNDCDDFIKLIATAPAPKSNKKTKSILDKMTDEVCVEIQKIDASLSTEDKTAELQAAIMSIFFINYDAVLDAYNIKDPENSDIFESIGVELGVNLANNCDGFLNVFE